MSDLFKKVKEAVTTRQAAEHYGLKVSRSGMCCCLFHKDRHPSMKLDKRFHCFGCGADGDVIDFTAQLFAITKKDAAEKLADAFGIALETVVYHPRDHPGIRMKGRQAKPALSPAIAYRLAEERCYLVYCDYAHLLRQWKADYAPKSPDDEWDDRFVEACHKLDYVEYILDEVFLSGTIRERAEFIITHEEEVLNLEKRIFQLTAGGSGSSYGGGNEDPAASKDPAVKPCNCFDDRTV